MEVDQQLAPPVVGVVVVHDVGEWFDETLRAFASQDYPNVRWLFLANGDDDLDDLTARIRAVVPEAFVRPSSAVGFGATANEALQLVEGDQGFFWICHDDIAPARDALRTLVTELYRSNAGMVGPKLVEWEEPRRLQHVGLGVDRFGEVDAIVEPGELDQQQHDAVRDVFVLPSACVLVRADLFRTLGGFDRAITFHGDDVDLCWRAHHSGARVVVAPDARVRHRERLEERRPDLDHGQLRARHRMRALATLTGRGRLAIRSIQLVVLTAVEMIAGLFTGRFGDGVASLRAMIGLIPRTGSLLARRRVIAPQRRVPEREVLGLQVRGSARLASYVRGRETTTYLGVDSTVRRWRPTSYAPMLAWMLVIAALIIGSRTFIDRGVPVVGEFLPFPESPRELGRAYLSGWDPRATGATTAVPTGWLSVALLSVLAAFRMELAMTLSVIGLVVVGAAGAWRLAAVFPATRARVVAMVVYVGTPLIPGVMATGRWSALAWYAALPWCVYFLRRMAGIGTADPELVDTDLVDGLAELPMRERVRYLALASLVLGVVAAFVPVVIAIWLVAGLVLVVTTLAVGGSVHTAGWFSIGTLGSALAAAALNLPWAATWTWPSLVPTPPAGPAADGIVGTAALAVDGRAFVVLALALYVPVVAALAIARAWRLTWAARAGGLVITFGAAAVLADRGDLPIDPPDQALLMVPVALGLALSAAAIAGGFGHDVLERGFGWRQPVAIVANLAILVGVVPAIIAIGNGGWNTPRTTVTSLVAAQLPADPADGDYRILFVGDPRVLPVPSLPYRDGIGVAIVDDGGLDFRERWAPPRPAGVDHVTVALDLMADGSTLRAGRMLAPLGIRYVVVPEVDGVDSTTADPLPVPAGLLDSLRDQLDLGETFGAPNVSVFVNRSWMPTTSLLTGATLDASLLDGLGSLGRADLSDAAPVFRGADPTRSAVDAVEPGAVHLGTALDQRWWMAVDGERLEPRPSFGVATAFDVPPTAAPGTPAELGYDTSPGRLAAVLFQTFCWLVVIVAASRARMPRHRRHDGVSSDETLIQLDTPADLDRWADDVPETLPSDSSPTGSLPSIDPALDPGRPG